MSRCCSWYRLVVASTQLILLLLQTVRLQISAAVRVSSLIKVPTSAWQLLPGVPTTSWGVIRRPLTQVPCLIWCLLPGIFDSAAARMTCCTPVSWVCQASDALMLSPSWLLLPVILPSTPFYHTQHVLRHTKQYHLYHPPCANCPGVLMASWGVCIRCPSANTNISLSLQSTWRPDAVASLAAAAADPPVRPLLPYQPCFHAYKTCAPTAKPQALGQRTSTYASHSCVKKVSWFSSFMPGRVAPASEARICG